MTTTPASQSDDAIPSEGIISMARELLPLPLWIADLAVQMTISTPMLLQAARLRGTFRYATSPGARKRLGKEIQLALPERSKKEVQAILRRHFQSTQQHDLLTSWPYRKDAGRLRMAPILGLEHLESALALGRGAIVATAHFGEGRLQKHILRAHGFKALTVGVTEGRAPSPSMSNRIKERLGVSGFSWARDNDLAAGINLRPHVAALSRNEIICIAIDGRQGMEYVDKDVLGTRTPLATGSLKVAWKTGAALLPAFTVETASGMPALLIHPPISRPATGSEEEDLKAGLAQFALALEETIRAYPHLHRWRRVSVVRKSKRGDVGRYAENHIERIRRTEAEAKSKSR